MLNDYILNDRFFLNTAIVNMKNKEGKEIDLVGAVHIGTEKYYSSLEKKLDESDYVLYEGVDKPENPKAFKHKLQMINYSNLKEMYAKIAESGTKIRAEKYPNIAKENLDIICQTSYFSEKTKQENWLHADLNLDELEAEIGFFSKDNFNFLRLALVSKLVIKIDFLSEKLAEELLKGYVLAEQKDSINIKSIEFPREQRVYEVLNQTLTKEHDKISIFYGAAHLGRIEENILVRGYERNKIEYITAWQKVF